jgi:hypothetical protein
VCVCVCVCVSCVYVCVSMSVCVYMYVHVYAYVCVSIDRGTVLHSLGTSCAESRGSSWVAGAPPCTRDL